MQPPEWGHLETKPLTSMVCNGWIYEWRFSCVQVLFKPNVCCFVKDVLKTSEWTVDKSCELTSPQACQIFANHWLLRPNPTGKAPLSPAGSTLLHLSVPAVPLGNQEWTLWKINVPLPPEHSPRPTWDESGPGRRRQPLGSSFRMFHSPGQQFPLQREGVWDPQQDTSQEDCWVCDTVEEDPERSSRSYPHQTAGRGGRGGATTFFCGCFSADDTLFYVRISLTFKPRNDPVILGYLFI